MNLSMPKVAIVVPCFNEELMLKKTDIELKNLLQSMKDKNEIAEDSYTVYVDDGSFDKTWDVIKEITGKNVHAKGVKLSRNFGHQNALIAGLEYVLHDCDANICIDADLQHDIAIIPEFIKHYKNGNHLVFGVKNSRKTDSFFKRFSAQFFYKLLKYFGVNIIYNHADFRLMSKEALGSLLEYREVNLFLRGIIPLVGFKNEKVYYDVKERDFGESKYSLRRMLSLAIEGVTSFSVAPLRLITMLGGVIFLFSFISIVGSIYSYFFDSVVPGWASLIVTICFFGGVQLVCIGIIGEYIGKIYKEVKKRPRYIIEEKA